MALMDKLKKALNAKLEEFDAKSKELSQEKGKFDKNKGNVFASLTNNLKLKKMITTKLDE